jgi:hypothetical protein
MGKPANKSCKMCGSALNNGGSSPLCDTCELTLFQIDTIISEYLLNPPSWLVEGVTEISSWVYNGNPRGAGYFNTANEIVEVFAIERKEEFPLEELKEMIYTNLPEKQVLKILKEALIIDYDTESIYPGPLSKKLMDIRWEGYEMDSLEVRKKIKEMHGIISVSITKGLLSRDKFKPQKALSPFKLVSRIILESNENNGIARDISEYDIDMAFLKLSQRQKNKIRREMCGFSDGETKIIKDKDIKGDMPLKDAVIIYSENMRERFRERNRDERIYD